MTSDKAVLLFSGNAMEGLGYVVIILLLMGIWVILLILIKRRPKSDDYLVMNLIKRRKKIDDSYDLDLKLEKSVQLEIKRIKEEGNDQLEPERAIWQLSVDKFSKWMSIISLILGFVSIFLVDLFRNFLIDQAYADKTAFNMVAPYSFGFYLIVIGMISNVVSYKLPSHVTQEEAINYVKQKSNSGIKSLIGPTMIQYISIHLVSLLAMFISYGAYAGFGKMLEGPAYYQNAILTYGLNRTAEISAIWNYIAIFTAPIFMLFIGTTLFVLQAGGFAPNGPGVQQTAIDSTFLDFGGVQFDIWGYFSKDIPFADIYFGSFKINLFYIFIVIVPILLGGLIGSLINYYKFDNRNSKYTNHMIFIAISSFIISIIYASISAPVFVSVSGIFESLLIDRRTNHFIRYKWIAFDDPDNGNYHPMSLFVIINILWVPIILYLTNLKRLIVGVTERKFLERKESEQILGKYLDHKETKLPFEKY
ncbi:MAG: hypothetical protein GPJ54_08315 [Candidatus Heimdallarchaeota archaeon]|nr:hypothetical protein [Candidatus Heimdallarchaeota archaeon]